MESLASSSLLGLDYANSITSRFGAQQLVDDLSKREDFCREVLGTTPFQGTALEIGCGMGFFTAALARRFERVLAMERSQTLSIVAVGLLDAQGLKNAVIYHGSLPEIADLSDSLHMVSRSQAHLVASYDGLRRDNLLDLSFMARYIKPLGMTLVVYPSWWFGNAKGELEQRLYQRGLAAGWTKDRHPAGRVLEQLDQGEAPKESVSLAYQAAMTGLRDLYDHKLDKAAADWDGPARFEIEMTWRLMHLPEEQ
ncbi:hypothetical protein K8R78_06170 [bacterium]|nr:hypothetical protein [bacterium]